MTVSDAWLLELSDSISIATGDHEMVEYLPAPICFSVPGSPGYCSRVLSWQDKLVPVMDISMLLGQPTADESKTLISLVAYQIESRAPLQHLALRVSKAPEKIQVDDEQACELPEEMNTSLLMPIFLSCFTYAERTAIIFDFASLCSAEFRDLANPAQNLIPDQPALAAADTN